jgi:hypothetical protein
VLRNALLCSSAGSQVPDSERPDNFTDVQ